MATDPPDRLRLIRSTSQLLRQFVQPLRYPVILDVLKRLAIHAWCSAIGFAAVIRENQYVLSIHLVVQSTEAKFGRSLRFCRATPSGNGNTLFCLSNDPAQCQQDSVTLNGTVSGTDVTIVVSFPGQSGTTTVNMAGSVTGTGALNGNYNDSLGGAGTWTASAATLTIEPGAVMGFAGTFNSTSSPQSIPPSISVELQRAQTNFSLRGMRAS